MITLDHLAVAGITRDIAAAHVTDTLGVPLQKGGEHAHFGTHNHLLGLAEGLYLEAIAINPDASDPGRPRWFALDDFAGPPRLSNWICRTDDLETLVRDLPEAGEIIALERGDLKWRMAVPADGVLPFDGCFPALIQWDCDTHPAGMLDQVGCRLDRLVVHHPNADRLQQILSPYLNDARVSFETGSTALAAHMTCRNGPVTLQ